MPTKRLPPVPRFEISADRLVELITELDLPIGLGQSPYLHWEQLRHKPVRGDYTHEEWWAICQLRRRSSSIQLPMPSASGEPFWFCQTDRIARALHRIDQQAAGSIAASGLPDADMQLQFLIDGHITEAITSAQLEGASTGHAIAASMLRSGAEPTDKDQQMIVNTFLALQEVANMPVELTVGDVCALHALVTTNTLDNDDDEGRIQKPCEKRVVVQDTRTGNVLHTPPSAEKLPQRMDRMCRFANEMLDEDRFLHPVLRAITLHFWLAYDHPFVDGNGRAARMLYYWLTEKRGFWMLKFVPISSLLKRQPAKYAMAYQYVESDNNDLTYFFEYQLKVICQTIDDFLELVRRRTDEIQRLEGKYRGEGFNHRQLALLSHALRNPVASYSAKTHGTSHGISGMTARKDLDALVAAGYLERAGKLGRLQLYRRNRRKMRVAAKSA